MRRSLYALLAVGVLLSVSGQAFAQAVPAAGAPVTREEFDKMMKEMAALRQEVTQLKAERAATQGAVPAAPGSAAEVAQLRQEVAALKQQRAADAADSQAYQDEIDKTIKDVVKQARANGMGQEKLLLTGDGAVGFTAQKGSPSTFFAGVAPRLLWKLNDQLMFDAGIDISVGRDSVTNENTSSFDLKIASVSYILNDYLVIGGGLFVSPFAAYHRDFDPSWITKLPDDPLVFSDGGLAPSSVLGAFISGAYPIGSTKVNYALYASNGPELMTGTDNAGSLGFDNFVDLNNNKAVGGRVGFLPMPELEVGYSILCGQANAAGDPTANAFLQAVDFNYTRTSNLLLGTIALRSEWVWSHVGDRTYTGTDGPLNFKNNRSGGYVQVAYRPSLVSIKELRNFEAIFRYDRLDAPAAAPGGGHEQRYTVGLDYWLDARSVLKVAYEFDHKSNDASAPAFLVQFGVGF